MQFIIAIAEDSELVLEQLATALEQNGFTPVIKARNGRDLLDQLQSLSQLPSLVLTDINIPDLDGFETIPILKARYPALKILATSTDYRRSKVRAILECGADDFIPKGSDISDYVSKMKQLLA